MGTFEKLKSVVVEAPILMLPNFEQPFEVWNDASDYAIGVVLMQEGRLVAFESRKLNETMRHYSMQENEMTTVVHCLRV